VGILNQDYISIFQGIVYFDSYICQIISDSVMTLIDMKTFYCLEFSLLHMLLLAVFVVGHAQISFCLMKILKNLKNAYSNGF
jgi:hypothetical protein